MIATSGTYLCYISCHCLDFLLLARSVREAGKDVFCMQFFELRNYIRVVSAVRDSLTTTRGNWHTFRLCVCENEMNLFRDVYPGERKSK